jgi:hypothetical protein
LLDKDVRTLKNLTRAKALEALFGQLLYEEIAELDPDEKHKIEGRTGQNLHIQALIAESVRQSPQSCQGDNFS